MAAGALDRRRQDVGNIVHLEHVNVRVPRQDLATVFYVLGLGLTRDPYLMVGLDNMWINVGQQQFHLPTGEPQVLRGRVGLVLADLEALAARLADVKGALADTRFGYQVESDRVSVTCPWGNQIRCHAPDRRLGDTTLGMAYVELTTEPGTADGILRFYERVMGAPGVVVREGGRAAARIRVGRAQELVFRETEEAIPAYDGHHVAIYISDFGGPYERLGALGLISMENGEYEYRFQDIVDPDTRRPLFRLEHEVRSLTHPIYFRPLVNRNPAQRQRTYVRGRDAFVP
jgi:hypothetical protein